MTRAEAPMVLCAAAALVPASAAGAPPAIVREDIDETFVDEPLSEACGVEATVGLTGHATRPGSRRTGRIVSLRGQLPFLFKGVLKFDGTTEQWLNEPNLAAGERQSARACAALNPEG